MFKKKTFTKKSYIADNLLRYNLQHVFSARVVHILKEKRNSWSYLQFIHFFCKLKQFQSCHQLTDLSITAVDPLQSKQPVWRSVACVKVVLDHFGRPLSRVMIGVELSRRHHMHLSLQFL